MKNDLQFVINAWNKITHSEFSTNPTWMWVAIKVFFFFLFHFNSGAAAEIIYDSKCSFIYIEIELLSEIDLY